jgi:ABC-2 type transport system ATP-binding protein
MPILAVQNLTKTFTQGLWPLTAVQAYTAVNDISFHIKKGEILGFLGTNGAGKTTTIQMLLGTLSPNSGSITYFGQNFASSRTEALKKIGYSSGYEKLPAQLSITQNLDIVGRIYGISEKNGASRLKNS